MKVLAQFKLLPNCVDFCLPELKSLLNMHDLDWREVFKHEFARKGEENTPHDYTVPESSEHYSYMHFKQANNRSKPILPDDPADIRYTSFRRFPFIYLEFPNLEISKQVIQRSVLLDVFVHPISEGHTYEEIIENADQTLLKNYNEEGQKFLFEVDPYNSHLSQKELIERIEIITEKLHMRGSIDLKKPAMKYWIMERHVDPYTQQTNSSISTTLLDIFFGAEIARSKSCTRISQKENYVNQYDLKNRIYLGPTSTDHSLSFLMCNQGAAKADSFILDPFVGSGSLLIPPSHYGAFCFGGDLDPRVLHGLGVGRINKKSKFYLPNAEYCNTMMPKIMLNFEQYKLPMPMITRMDCINTNLRAAEVFDAIICDPPYGFRAMTRTAGKKEKKKRVKKPKVEGEQNQEEGKLNESAEEGEEEKEETQRETEQTEEEKGQDEKDKSLTTDQEKTTVNADSQPNSETPVDDQPQKFINIPDDQHTPSFPQMISVSVDSIVSGLVGLGSRILAPGGRLVFLYPIEREIYNIAGISHLKYPNFTLIDYSENPLSEKKSRILVTLQKNLSNAEFEKLQKKEKEDQEKFLAENEAGSQQNSEDTTNIALNNVNIEQKS